MINGMGQSNLYVEVFQEPLAANQGQLLFKKNIDGALFPACGQLFKKYFPNDHYPKEQIEKKFHQLFQTVTIGKRIDIIIASQELDWQAFLRKVGQYYPQLVWYQGTVQEENERVRYTFNFVPLVLKEHGFPFGLNLVESLIQQDIPESGDPLEEWRKELRYLCEDLLNNQEQKTEVAEVEPAQPVESKEAAPKEDELSKTIPFYKKKTFYSGQDVMQAREKAKNLDSENEYLKTEKKRLLAELEELQLKNAKLVQAFQEEQAKAVAEESSPTNGTIESAQRLKELERQNIYFAEELKREKDAKERMRLAKEKLEHVVTRLEKQLLTSSMEFLENEPPYVERDDHWYKKITVDLRDYDQCYQKAKYLEHTWKVNQELITTSEKFTITPSKLTYERERVQKIKNSTKEIELFVMMDECRAISERVKIRKGFLFLKPRVKILKGDYDNLMEKAAYFDVLQSENQLLERIIQDQIDDEHNVPKQAEKI